MLTRREFLKTLSGAGVAVGLGPAGCTWQAQSGTTTAVNDIHSQLNLTRVHRVVKPQSAETIQAVVRSARAEGRAISIAGGTVKVKDELKIEFDIVAQ